MMTACQVSEEDAEKTGQASDRELFEHFLYRQFNNIKNGLVEKDPQT